MENSILVSFPEDHVGVLTLNRPDFNNAANNLLLESLATELARMRLNPDVQAVVLAGSESVFGAGGDLAEMSAATPVELWGSPRHDWWGEVNRFPKPLIAAVNGPAYGGGCELALASDIVIAGSNARFALPEIKLGLVPGRGGTQRLPLVVGKSAAMHMVLTGEPIDAERALSLGIAWEITDPSKTLESAISLAKTIAKRAPVAVGIAKELVQRAATPLLEQGAALERHCYEFLTGTEDGQEGMRAFLEKRSPNFSGK